MSLSVCTATLTGKLGVGGVGFMLSRRQDEEIGRAVARFQRLTPHLTRAIDLTLQFGERVGDAWQIGLVR
jgi:hypothetical protein